jgi:hypothetical protein
MAASDAHSPAFITPAEHAPRFARAKPDEVAKILETLAVLGRARPSDEKGTFVH